MPKQRAAASVPTSQKAPSATKSPKATKAAKAAKGPKAAKGQKRRDADAPFAVKHVGRTIVGF